MRAAVEVAVRGTDVLGECPIWDERSRVLWWVDSRGPTVKRLDPATGAVTTLALPETVGSITMRERGGLLDELAESRFAG